MRHCILLMLVLYHLSATELVPGRVARIPFPDLSDTLAGGQAQLLIRLPEGYSRDRDYPVFCWFNGGSGPPGTPTRYTKDLPYIVISMPLFKRRRGGGVDGLHLQHDDAATIWEAHSTMLAHFDQLVPNTDPTRSIVGGFSNGAHCIAVLASTPAFLQRYRGILFCDGGGYLVNDTKLLGASTVVMMATGEQSPAYGRFTGFAQRAERDGVAVELLSMPGVGHAAPPNDHLPTVHRWVADQIYYAGLTEAYAAMQALIENQRWPEAMAAYRRVASVVDERRDEWAGTQAAFERLRAACAEAIAELDPQTARADDLRTFIGTWRPCPDLDPVRDWANRRADDELAAIATGRGLRQQRQLLAFYRTWEGFPVQQAALAHLEERAAEQLAQALDQGNERGRERALRALISALPMCPSTDTARQELETIAAGQLEELLALEQYQRAIPRLERFVRSFGDLPSGARAQESLAVHEAAWAADLLVQFRTIPDRRRRDTMLQALVDRFPGTEAAREAAATLVR